MSSSMAHFPASADEEDSGTKKIARITVPVLTDVIKEAIKGRQGLLAEMIRNKQVFVYDPIIVRHLSTAVAA